MKNVLRPSRQRHPQPRLQWRSGFLGSRSARGVGKARHPGAIAPERRQEQRGYMRDVLQTTKQVCHPLKVHAPPALVRMENSGH